MQYYNNNSNNNNYYYGSYNNEMGSSNTNSRSSAQGFNLGNMFSSGIDFNALFKTNDLTSDIQSHLSRVYATLTAGILVAAVGVYLHLLLNIGGLLTTLGSLGVIVWIGMDQDKNNLSKRLGMFAAFTLLQGASLGPLIELLLFVDPSILVTALLGTATIFACFSIASMLAKRRSLLYIGGICSSVLSAMFMLSLINMFTRSETLAVLQLYVGLFLFMGYVVFDTQSIIERASLGDKDIVGHAVQLFIDFAAIFVRIAIILLRNSEKKNKKSRR